MKIKAIHNAFSCSNCGVLYGSMTYKIEGSLDGKAWHVLVAEKTTTTGEGEDLFSPPVETRFIRTTLLKASMPNSPNAWVGMAKQDIEID